MRKNNIFSRKTLALPYAVFMILFGVNFTLFYLILTGNIMQALKSEELHWYLGIIAGSAIVIAFNILPQYENIWEALRYSVFQVSSLISTTGFITADYEKWPMLSQIILMGLVFVGACAGSTGGGLKVSRILKRRTVAQEACSEEKVVINGKAAKPSTNVKIGDEVQIVCAAATFKFKILQIKETVKKDEAKELFRYL